MLTRRVSVGRAALLVCLAGSMVVSPALAQTVTLPAPMTTAIDAHTGDPAFWITSGGGEFPPPTSDQITAKIDDIMANDPNYEKDSDPAKPLLLSTAKGELIYGHLSANQLTGNPGDYQGGDNQWYVKGTTTQGSDVVIPVKIAAGGATPSAEQNNSAAGRAQRNKTVLQTGVQDYITSTTGGVGACSDQLTDAIDALYISSGTVGLAASILTAATSILSWLGGEIPANLMAAVGAGLGLGGAITTQVANGMPNCEAQFTGTIQGDANIYAGLGIAAFDNAITLGSKDGQSYVKGVSLGGGMLQGAGTGGAEATAVDGDSVAIGNGSYAGPGNTAIGTNAEARGLESTAIGNGAQALGDYSTAIGHGALAEGDASTAVGNGATATGDNSTAIGQAAVASGEASTAVGQGATADAENASAFGQHAWAAAINASAFGQDAWATGENSSAFGQDAWASAQNASAFGKGASASGAGATALGVGSNAEGENGVAIGDADVFALATDGVAIGTGAAAGAEKATALGAGAGALGQGSIAIGDADVVALATDGIAIGTGAGVLGEQSIAMGSGAIAGSGAPGDAGGSIAVGANSTALGTDATAYGKGAVANGEDVSAIGQNSTAIGKLATASGSGATADGEAVAAFGSNAKAGGTGNTAIGDDAQAFGGGPLLGTSNMTALGQASRAYASNTLAAGQGAWAIAEGATALGQGSLASGIGATATGFGAVASGIGSTSNGQGSRASGNGATAVGSGAVADFARSAAYGEGAVASAIGQQVFGTTDNTYAMRGLTSHLSTVRQSGPKSLVTSDQNGNLAADDGMYEQIGQNQQGVAMAMALGNFWVPESKTFALGVNTATFDGVWALGVNVGGQIKDGLNLNGGIAASSSGMVTGRAGALMSW